MLLLRAAAAVAVGVMPVKKAAMASSLFPKILHRNQLPMPIPMLASRMFRCPSRSVRQETLTCRKTRNIMMTISQRISPFSAEAHGQR